MATIEPGVYVRTPDGVGKVLTKNRDTGVLTVTTFANRPVPRTRSYRADEATFLTRDPLVAKIEATLDRYEAALDEDGDRQYLLESLISDMRALTVAATPERTSGG